MTTEPRPLAPVTLDLLLAHRAWVRSVARAVVSDENDADDVEQETWLRAIAHPPSHAGSLRGWLGTATRNVARKLGRGARRRERHQFAAPPPPEASGAEDLVAEAELQQRIGRAVLELEEPFRSTVLLRHFDGLPPREVAARLGVPVETVRSRLRRAHERLRTKLDGSDGDRTWSRAVLAWLDRDPVPRAAARATVVGGAAMTMAQELLVAAVLFVAGATAVWTARTDSGPSASTTATIVREAALPTDLRRAQRGHPDDRSVALPPDGPPPPVDLDRVDRELDLHGAVVDADGRPVAHARIATIVTQWRTSRLLGAILPESEQPGPTTRSATDGTFGVRLSRGEHVALRASAPGLALVEFPNVVAGERLRITLPRPVRLTVAVSDASGSPVEDATVRLSEDETGRSGPIVRRTGTSDASGACVFPDLPSGGWISVRVLSRSGASDASRTSLGAGSEARLDVRLPPCRTIRGRVLDAATGQPIAGATVGMDWELAVAVTTAPDGTFELPGWSNGFMSVQAVAEGYAREHRSSWADDRIEFAMSRGFAMTGRAVDAEHHPLAGAIVGVIGTQIDDQNDHFAIGDATTDADGRFRVPNLRVGIHHVLVASCPGHARARREALVGEAADDLSIGDIVLARSHRVEGVVSTTPGAPISGTAVALYGPEESFGVEDAGNFYGRSLSAYTDDRGRFAFADVAPGSYTIRSSPPSAPVTSIRVQVPSDGDSVGLRIVHEATREVLVTVVDTAGAPVADICVNGSERSRTWEGVRAQTGPDGSARLSVREGADVSLKLLTTFLPGRSFVDPPPHALRDDETAVRFVLVEAGMLPGRLVGPDDEPVAGATIRFRAADDVQSTAMTGNDGRLAVLISRDHPSVLEFDGIVERDGSAADCGLTCRVEGVLPGTDREFRCERAAKDRRLTVLVVAPGGAPVPCATVTLRNEAGDVASASTDATGHACFESLAAREVKAWAKSPGDTFLPSVQTPVSPDGQELRLALRAAVRITGSVVGPNGAARPKEHVVAFRGADYVGIARSGDDGRFVLLLPAGNPAIVRLVVVHDLDGEPEAALDGIAPGASDVRLELSR